MRFLLRKVVKVGYFRPIIDANGNKLNDNHINTMISFFDLGMDPNDFFAWTRHEYIKMRNSGRQGEIIDLIIEKYKALEDQCTVIVDEIRNGLYIEHDSYKIWFELKKLAALSQQKKN